MKGKPIARIIILVIVLLGAWFLSRKGINQLPPQDREFNRSGTNLIYTKHALCRMDCRSVDRQDIEQIIRDGEVDWSKSDMNDKPCPTYALEGNCRHGDKLRVIFAQCSQSTKVVTCYPLNRHPDCHCPGDKN